MITSVLRYIPTAFIPVRRSPFVTHPQLVIFISLQRIPIRDSEFVSTNNLATIRDNLFYLGESDNIIVLVSDI